MLTPLLWSGVGGAILFVVTFLIEGLTRPGYDARRQPVSALALGPGGWMQQANFVLTGILMLLFAAGLGIGLRGLGGSPLAPLLVSVYAVGLIVAGVFVTDPVAGYPPDPPPAPSRHGRVHDLSAVFVFVPLFAACLVVGRLLAASGSPAWALYSLLIAIIIPVGVVVAGLGFGGSTRLAAEAGIAQRIAIVAGWAWLALVALHLLGIAG
ncbi:MAG TPA: DUF998 domain-containing protein [Candidatus Dormibacteraeota bacterium]|jgi:hypothetical membrane protein|nr:DUF998 domain-containing protein [Candidatus Dormibacteraeota bacterium]